MNEPDLSRCRTCGTALYLCVQGFGVCCGGCKPGHVEGEATDPGKAPRCGHDHSEGCCDGIAWCGQPCCPTVPETSREEELRGLADDAARDAQAEILAAEAGGEPT